MAKLDPQQQIPQSVRKYFQLDPLLNDEGVNFADDDTGYGQGDWNLRSNFSFLQYIRDLGYKGPINDEKRAAAFASGMMDGNGKLLPPGTYQPANFFNDDMFRKFSEVAPEYRQQYKPYVKADSFMDKAIDIGIPVALTAGQAYLAAPAYAGGLVGGAEGGTAVGAGGGGALAGGGSSAVGSGVLSGAGAGAAGAGGASIVDAALTGPSSSAATLSEIAGNTPIGTQLTNPLAGGPISNVASAARNFLPTGSGLPQIASGALQGALGYFGAEAQGDAYKDVANQYLGIGAPYRDLLLDSYGKDFDLFDQSAYRNAAKRSADISTRAWSAQGNPANNPGIAGSIFNDVLTQTTLPALSNYRGGLMQAGGMGLNTSGNASMSSADTVGQGFNALGYGVGTAMNPQPSVEDILKKYGTSGQGLQLNVGGNPYGR